MDDRPSSSVNVLIGYVLDIAVQSELEEARRQHVQGCRRSVLNDHDRAEILGDDLRESGEVLDDGAYVRDQLR